MLKVQREAIVSVSRNNKRLRNTMTHLFRPDFPLSAFQLCQHHVGLNNGRSFSFFLFFLASLVRGLGDIYSDNPLSDSSLASCSESLFKTQAQVDPLK